MQAPISRCRRWRKLSDAASSFSPTTSCTRVFPDRPSRSSSNRSPRLSPGSSPARAYLSGRSLHAALFPKHDPTLREPLPETVNAIGMKDLRNYYKAVFRPDLTTIVVIGKVTPQRARTVIEKYFGAWSATGPTPTTVLPAVPLNAPAISAVPDASRVQDRVTLAETLGLTRLSPDYYALELGNNVLGGAFYASRLSRDIRKDAGLVYYVESQFQFSRTRGIYFVQYACDPQNVGEGARHGSEGSSGRCRRPRSRRMNSRVPRRSCCARFPSTRRMLTTLHTASSSAGISAFRSTNRRLQRDAIWRWAHRKCRPLSQNGCGPMIWCA